jgi:4-diphosphocytidyl-2-C-methyl-D-erythritol kinase
MPTVVRSYSKINLGLAIGPVRPDGFHGLTTLYQTLAMHDRVEVAAVRADTTEITLASNHPGVPLDERNTAWRMVAGALDGMDVRARVHVHIQKDLPVQGGMGAGSANAAAALLGLERELGETLPAGERLRLAAAVGSDVPLFLVGGAVLGLERGETVYPMPDISVTACVVVLPERGVSTPQAFRDWDALWADSRTRGSDKAGRQAGAEPSFTQGLQSDPQSVRLIELSHTLASAFAARFAAASVGSGASGILQGESPAGQGRSGEPSQNTPSNDLAENTLLALVRTGIENDFEQVVFPQYPLLRDLKRALMGINSAGSVGHGVGDAYTASGCIYAALSGSGSALFGLYRSVGDAEAAQRRIRGMGVRALVTETIPRSRYWDTMFAG